MEQDLPTCVRFSPKDEELIKLFLEPKINQRVIDKCVIQHVDVYDKHPDMLRNEPNYYFPEGEYWFFVTRIRKGNKIKRTVGTGNKNGRWVHRKTTAIKEAGQTIGEKQKFIFIDKQKRCCGWHQYEYRLPSPQYMIVVSHMVYKAEDDVRDQAQPLMDIEAAIMQEPEENMIQDEAVENSLQGIMSDFQRLLSPDHMDIDAA